MKALTNYFSRLAWRLRVRKWKVPVTEPEVSLLPSLCSRSGTAVDIGASVGMYTLHMLGYSQNVVSFEPRPDAAGELQGAVAACSRCKVENVALSDTTGTTTMRISRESAGMSTIDPHNRFDGTAIEVPVRTLDSYGLSNVSCIKIDVEGHEEAVLRGALNTIKRDRPALIVESEERHNPGAPGRVIELLMGLGYSAHQMNHGELVSCNGTKFVQHNFVFLRPKN